MITCIVLSAGFSSRFGSPKALAELDGQPLIVSLQNKLLTTNVDEIIVVLGHSADNIKPHLLNHKKLKVVYNKDYNFGQTSSFKAGLTAVSEKCTGILLLPVDFPFVAAATVSAECAHFAKKKSTILIPTYQAKKGHPPVFHASLKKDFLALDNDQGINTVSWQRSAEVNLLATDDPGVTASFNTPEEWEKLKNLFSRRV